MIINCMTAKSTKHEKCQDASACWTNGAVSLTAVSDGHSDPKCDRSGTGSRMAVESAVEILSLELSRRNSELRIREQGDDYIEGICSMIIGRWKEKIKEDYDSKVDENKAFNDYLTVKELKKAGYSVRDLREAGYSAEEVKDAGYSAKFLMDAGYSVAELRSAGFTMMELRKAGFSADEIKEAYDADGLDETGYDISEREIPDRSKDDFTVRYGATVVIGAMTPNYAIGIQIGDGKLFCIHRNGRISEPLPLDERCTGNYTTSLSGSDPMSTLHYFYRPMEDIVGIAVGTDGFVNCYSAENAPKEIRRVVSEMDVKDGWYMETCRRLMKLTDNGNKDDVSISVACSEKTDFTLFEALATNKLPVLEHGSPSPVVSKICVDGEIIGGYVVEDEMVLYNGIFYFDARKIGGHPTGTFVDGNIATGRIKMPPIVKTECNYGLYPTEEGVFWLFKNDIRSKDYSNIDNKFMTVDPDGERIYYYKPEGKMTLSEKNDKKKRGA